MDPYAHRGRGRNDQADAYWRRRFFTLVAGLGVLGLLAWAFSGTGGNTAHQAAGTGQAGHRNASAAAYGSAAPGQSGGASATPSGQPSGQASVSLPASATPRATSQAPKQAGQKSAAGQPSPGPGQPGKAGPAAGTRGGVCPARDIVLTLAVSKPAYGPGVHPKFQIDIVSTAPADCTFSTGRESLRVLITGGSRATWDSGACLHGATAHVEDLRRGVPSVISIGWDRHLRTGVCTTAEVAAAPGWYEAMAVSGTVTSPAKAFELR
jgi:hypothetical protein